MAAVVPDNHGRWVISHGIDSYELRQMNKRRCLSNMNKKLGQFFRMTTDGARYAHNRNSRGVLVPALITLTYPNNSVWQPEQITAFINNLRNHAQRSWGIALRYAWVAEATKRGVIHYHVVVWQPRNKQFPKPDEKGWWPHGLSQIAAVKKGVGKYLMKYLTKGSDLGIYRYNDKGRRIHVRSYAVGGLDKKEAEFLSHVMLPVEIKKAFGPIPFGPKIRKVKGGWKCRGLRKKVDSMGGFKCWGLEDVFVMGNWDFGRSPETGLWHIEGNIRWSLLPDEPLKDIWIPF